MRHFDLYDADQVDQLVHPENFQKISSGSSAKVIFTDFAEHEPLVIEASSSAIEAENMMRRSHVRLKLVIDEHGLFLGVIALEDLSKRQDLKVFDYADLDLMTVADVLTVLKLSGHQHCLVVEREKHQIRGVISASDIARKLKMDISIQQPPKFAELYLSSLHR